MKTKILSIFLVICLLFSAFVPVYASNEAETEGVPFIISRFEEAFGRAINIFARLFNLISGKNEQNIPTPNTNPHSWVFYEGDLQGEEIEQILETQTWIANEISFESAKNYADFFNDVDVDLLLFGNGRLYTIPGFWDGNNIFKFRFACPLEGTWYYKTVCSDLDNSSLHNRVGKVICSDYSGEKDVYKHGFVTTAYGEKYFTYDDGQPFFYVGDTHWSLGDETIQMVDIICQKRVEQGFTVYQSEPIGADFDFTNGITEDDMAGLADYDKKFKTIAEYGLTHANAQFFFTADMERLITLNGSVKPNGELSDTVKIYLEKISRYWVARYGAYPVIWTLGQECDNDFYQDSNKNAVWNYKNNPYKLVAEYIAKYDAYDHPLSAHMEHSGATSAYGDGKNANDKQKVYNKNAQASCFRDVKAHNFYAAQWNPSKTKSSNFNKEKDFWFNSQGKPVINYEGQYCYFWTKDFGARMQGYLAFLNGMYGYGWGANDTWSYLNPYEEDKTSTDGVDIITSEEKINATWQDALEYKSSYQMSYMRDFFEKTEWYKLIPRFNNKAYFVPCTNVLYAYASNEDNSEIVIYFYSFSDSSIAEKPNASYIESIKAGTVGKLIPNKTYTYYWFDPVTGEYSEKNEFIADRLGTYFIKQKPKGTDMILHITAGV